MPNTVMSLTVHRMQTICNLGEQVLSVLVLQMQPGAFALISGVIDNL